jgi:hypothetical protein
VPERHGKHSGHAEDQREDEKIPLFPKEIEVRVLEEFHAAYGPFKKSVDSRQSLVVRAASVVFGFANDNRPND